MDYTIYNQFFGNLNYSIFPPIKQQKDVVLTKELLYKSIDADTLYRWVYVPYSMIEVMWDYVDSASNIAIRRKMKNIKRAMFSLKELRKFCMQDMHPPGVESHQWSENDCLKFEDVFEEQFSELYDFFSKRLIDAYPDIDLEERMLYGAMYCAYIIHMSIKDYCEKFQDKITKRFNVYHKSVLPRDFNKVADVIKQIINEKKISLSSSELYKIKCNLSNMLYDIEFYNDEEKLKRVTIPFKKKLEI